MRVPFFGLDRQYQRYRQAFLDITDRVLASGQVLQGADTAEMERILSRLCGRKDAVAMGSCTDALAFALLATGIKPGDEVLVTSFTFIASLSPILRVGATPRFVDIDPATYLMDPELLDRLVTPRTRALLAVHLYGQTLPMDTIESFAQRHGLVLIEDAAQSLGSADGGRPAGSMGRVSCVSFDPTKVIGSFSSAGALLSDDPAICATARALRYHGRDPRTRRYDRLGFNSQLSTEMAAHLVFKLARLEEWLRERDAVARIYRDGLEGVGEVALPRLRSGSTHNWHKFVIRTSRRDALASFLKERGVETMIHYPRPVCDEPLVQALSLPPDSVHVPEARRAAAEVLSLPLFPDLTAEEARYVVAQVRAYFAEGIQT